jgi:hypothetical protein
MSAHFKSIIFFDGNMIAIRGELVLQAPGMPEQSDITLLVTSDSASLTFEVNDEEVVRVEDISYEQLRDLRNFLNYALAEEDKKAAA